MPRPATLQALFWNSTVFGVCLLALQADRFSISREDGLNILVLVFCLSALCFGLGRLIRFMAPRNDLRFAHIQLQLLTLSAAISLILLLSALAITLSGLALSPGPPLFELRPDGLVMLNAAVREAVFTVLVMVICAAAHRLGAHAMTESR